MPAARGSGVMESLRVPTPERIVDLAAISGVAPGELAQPPAIREQSLKEHLDNSLMLVQKAAEISLKAYREDLSLKETALELSYLTAEQFGDW
jgi:hypothetical protein